MKKYLVLLVILGFTNLLFSQVDLETVWKKNVFPVEINEAKFSADGNFIYCAIGNTIQKMDAKTGEFVSIFDNVDTLPYALISKMQISELGNYIVAGYAGAAIIYDTRTEKKIKHIQLGVSSVAITPDERYLIIGSLRPEYNGVVKYNIEKDQIEKIFTFNPFGIDQIAVSNDGKYFATGTYYQDQTLNRFWHDQLILWEIITMTPIDTVEDIETGSSISGYRFLKFSLDDKYLGCVRMEPLEVHIYYTDTKNRVKSSDGRRCVNIEFLPDSLHYLLSYDNPEFNELVTNKFSGYLNRYLPYVESSIAKKTIFGKAGDSIFLFSIKTTDVTSEQQINRGVFDLNISNGKVIFNNYTIIGEVQIAISDLLGKELFFDNLSNIFPNNKITLKAQLPTGFYICKIVSNNKEYSQKFEIVR